MESTGLSAANQNRGHCRVENCHRGKESETGTCHVLCARVNGIGFWFVGRQWVELSRVFFDAPGPGEGEHQQPKGGDRQIQVSDCGITRRAEEPVGEDEGEHQVHQDVHCEFGEAAEREKSNVASGPRNQTCGVQQVLVLLCFLQEETDGCMVELQNMVQNVTHAETEIQQMVNLLQDLENAFNASKQRQEEVRSSTQQTFVPLTVSPHRPQLPLLLTLADISSPESVRHVVPLKDLFVIHSFQSSVF